MFFRFCNKQRFHLCHVTPVNKPTTIPDLLLQNACAVQVSPREGLIHAKQTAEALLSVREITSGILWVSSAGELAVRALVDTECMLICLYLRPGWRKQ